MQYCNPLSISFVEFLTGVLFICVFIKFGLTFHFLKAIIFITCLLITAFIDLKYLIIPDQVILPSLAVGLILNTVLYCKRLPYYLAGFALGGGIILLIVVLSRGGMGCGDIKLFATVGLFLGLRHTVLAILLSFISGSIVGLIFIIFKIKKMKDAIPFGPFIALGSVVSLLIGDNIISWYLDILF